jgi:arginase family enzyme
MHGMPIGFLTGVRKYKEKARLSPKEVVFLGIRDYEEYEEKWLAERKMSYYHAKDCADEKFEEIYDEIEKLFDQDLSREPYFMSFDIDGMCGDYFKSTGTCAPGGLSEKFVVDCFEKFLPLCCGMDFSEVAFSLTKHKNPEQNVTDKETFRRLFETAVRAASSRKFTF